MNGFGSDPRQDLVKRSALRMARPIKAKDLDRFAAAKNSLDEQFGRAIVHDALMMLMDYEAGFLTVDERMWWHEAMWAEMPDDVRDDMGKKSVECISQQLASEGFIPGTDFSIDADGQLYMNDEATKALIHSIPKDARKAVEKKTGVKEPHVEPEPWLHPLAEAGMKIEGKDDEFMNFWCAASMMANVATGRGMESTAAAYDACIQMGKKSGKTEQEMKKLIRKAKTDGAAIRQLVTIVHDGLQMSCDEAFKK